MSKSIKAKIEIAAEISQYDVKRCSRDCPFCKKKTGITSVI